MMITVGYPLLKNMARSELQTMGEISAVRGHLPGAQSGNPSDEDKFSNTSALHGYLLLLGSLHSHKVHFHIQATLHFSKLSHNGQYQSLKALCGSNDTRKGFLLTLTSPVPGL